MTRQQECKPNVGTKINTAFSSRIQESIEINSSGNKKRNLDQWKRNIIGIADQILQKWHVKKGLLIRSEPKQTKVLQRWNIDLQAEIKTP